MMPLAPLLVLAASLAGDLDNDPDGGSGIDQLASTEGIDFESSSESAALEVALDRDESGDFHLTFDLTWEQPGQVLAVPGLFTLRVLPGGTLRAESAVTDAPVRISQSKEPIVRGQVARIGISAALEHFERVSFVQDDTHFSHRSIDTGGLGGDVVLELGRSDERDAWIGFITNLQQGPGTIPTQTLLDRFEAPEEPTPRAVFATGEAWASAERSHFAIVEDQLVWAPAQWRAEDLEPGPLARTATPQVMLPDGRIVVFSGEVRDTHHGPMETVSDTWVYDPEGPTWTRIDSPEAPSGRTHQPMAFDARTGSVLMVGGWDNGMGRSEYPDDFWALDLEQGRWHLINEGVNLLFPKADIACLHVPTFESIVVFGKRSPWMITDDPTRPTPLRPYVDFPAKLPPRSAGFVCDPATSRVWFFGGNDLENWVDKVEGKQDHTCVWDPETGAIERIDLEHRPPLRSRPLVGFDPELRRMLLFGGSVSQDLRRDDFWTFDVDEQVWREHLQADCPGPRGGFMAPSFDTVRGELVMALGRSGRSRFHQDVWRLRFDPAAEGSVDVVLSRAEAPDARGIEVETSGGAGARVVATIVELDETAARVRLTAEGVDESDPVHVHRIGLAVEPSAEVEGRQRSWLEL